MSRPCGPTCARYDLALLTEESTDDKARLQKPAFWSVACDFYGQPLELNRADSTFMNHRGVLYASDDELVEEIRELWPIDGK